jgi:hypothetical protein
MNSVNSTIVKQRTAIAPTESADAKKHLAFPLVFLLAFSFCICVKQEGGQVNYEEVKEGI